MCEHLQTLENELRDLNIKETWRGQPWSDNCREWVYFDCYLECETLRNRLNLPAFIKQYHNDDKRSGLEEGFICELCNDAIIGLHRSIKNVDNKQVVK